MKNDVNAPTNLKELFHALAVSVHKSGSGTDYGHPWAGYVAAEDGGAPCYKQARGRLDHFERNCTDKVEWVYFNDSASNEGAMSLNSDPGRAFTERVTNGIDACIELKILDCPGDKPRSPLEAVQTLWNIEPDDLVQGVSDGALRKLATDSVIARHYAPSNAADKRDNVLDARDYGIGMTAEEMPGTILSLNRGNKKHKMYLTGKHGQGASSTFQFADMTVIASRKVGTDRVAFTIVEKHWDCDPVTGEPRSKTPTYRSLRVNGKVPELCLEDAGEFAVGTLVRHIGYEVHLPSNLSENSVLGLLTRTLATALLPIGVEHFFMRYGERSNGAKGGKKNVIRTLPGRRTFRTTRGSVAALRRAHWESNNIPAVKRPHDSAKIAHYYSEPFLLGKTDLGGRDGVVDLGQVRFEWWVTIPDDSTGPHEALRGYVDPAKPVLITLEGQTHGMESRSLICAASSSGVNGGAGLWAVGKRMVVHINCDGLDQRARYELFTSTREHLKENPLKRRILDELIHRLKRDDVLTRINREISAPPSSTDELDQDFADQVRQHLKAGVSLDTMTRKVKEKIDIEEETTGEGPVARKQKSREAPVPPAPIAAVDNPTFLRWRLLTRNVKMYPGQRYSWVFETDAPAPIWNPEHPTRGRIQLLDSSAVRYSGAAPWDGGRVRCRFECPETAVIGSSGTVQIQMRLPSGALVADTLCIEVVERSRHNSNPSGQGNDGDGEGDGEQEPGATTTKQNKPGKSQGVDRPVPYLRPVPLSRTKTPDGWGALGWPQNDFGVAFVVRRDSDTNVRRMYYNEDYHVLVELQKKWATRGLDKAFTDLYLIKLAMHGVFGLNHDVPDDDILDDAGKTSFRRFACATNDDLLWAASAEIDLKLREDRETT